MISEFLDIGTWLDPEDRYIRDAHTVHCDTCAEDIEFAENLNQDRCPVCNVRFQ